MPSKQVHSNTTPMVEKPTQFPNPLNTMEEEYLQSSIEEIKTRQLLRRSIHNFLKNYQYFTITASLLAFPFSAALLLSQSLLPSSPLLPSIHFRLRSLFDAAGFPHSSNLFSFLNLKFSQTITSAVLVLPFTLSFLLIAKASVIQLIKQQKPNSNSNSNSNHPSFFSLIAVYNQILITQVCNFFLLLSANATSFAILLIAFNCLKGFGYYLPNPIIFLSASGAVFYSIVFANAIVVTNLALVSSGMDKNGGYLAILKACVLIRGRTATALALAIPCNMVLAAIESLFQYRVAKAYYSTKSINSYMVLEGVFIAYLYSVVVVIDTIVSCMLFKSCKAACEIEQERRYAAYFGRNKIGNSKVLEEIA